jgi:hypothetical protein
MNGHRTVVGFCMLCALLISAVGAQSASAVGTTTYTCVKGGGGGTTYNTAHCRPSDGAGEYSHKSIENGLTTETRQNNKDHNGTLIPGTLVSTVFGTTVEMKVETVTGEGTSTNSEEGGEMFSSGSATMTMSNITVVKPANCKVQTDGPGKEKGEDGVVHSEPLKATTKGQGDRVKLEPAAGTIFARYWMEGASCPLKETTFTLTGSVTSVPNGATGNFTEADTTAQNTLKLNGSKAGVSGSLTSEGRANSSDTYKPITVTT